MRQQAAPEVDIERFDGNLLNLKYFIETEVDDPRGPLTCLIKYTSGEVKELVKNCLYVRASEGYKEAIRMMNERYGDPHKILAAYRKKIKDWIKMKSGDTVDSDDSSTS